MNYRSIRLVSCKPKYKSGSDKRIGTDIILVSTDQNQGNLHTVRYYHRLNNQVKNINQ